MADITKCNGEGCPWKAGCHRFTAKANDDRQAYFAESPGKMVDEYFVCEMFWGNKVEDIFAQLKEILGHNETKD